MPTDQHNSNIPPVERVERYTCDNCGETFERTFPRKIQCLVNHPFGQCCHYGDTVITRRQLQKEREVQQVVEQERKEVKDGV